MSLVFNKYETVSDGSVIICFECSYLFINDCLEKIEFWSLQRCHRMSSLNFTNDMRYCPKK